MPCVLGKFNYCQSHIASFLLIMYREKIYDMKNENNE